MGKSTSKIMETLCVPGWPKRYIVTNTEKVILVTYDIRFAESMAHSIKQLENPKNYYPRIR